MSTKETLFNVTVRTQSQITNLKHFFIFDITSREGNEKFASPKYNPAEVLCNSKSLVTLPKVTLVSSLVVSYHQ